LKIIVAELFAIRLLVYFNHSEIAVAAFRNALWNVVNDIAALRIDANLYHFL